MTDFRREDGVRAAERDDLRWADFESLGETLDKSNEDCAPARDLVRAIESEVLPRLMLAHQNREAASGWTETISPEAVEAFSEALLTGSAEVGIQAVDALMQSGAPIEDVFSELLAPAARRLGEYWENDEADFADVTIGLCRLHEILRHNSVVGDAAFRAGSDVKTRRSILLSTACDDQHVFGLLMVAEFFRRANWRVWSEPGTSIAVLSDIVGKNDVDIVGFSVVKAPIEAELQSEISCLRRAAANPDMKIIVGGAHIQSDPDIVHRVGADAALLDARTAPAMAEGLLTDARIGV
ncbi:MAG: cobalamin-dependent protein [Pseudomonadota bacterium]